MKALPHLRTAAGESNTPVSTSERRAQGSALMPGRIDRAEIGSRRVDPIEQEDLNCGFPRRSRNSTPIRLFKEMPRYSKGKKRFG